MALVKNPPSLKDFKLQIDRLKRPVSTDAKHSWYKFLTFPTSFLSEHPEISEGPLLFAFERILNGCNEN